MDILQETDFEFYGLKKTGKVRDVYQQPHQIILVTTDRHSSFDRIVAHVPYKGQILNQISAFWFDKTQDIISNHVLAIPDANVTVAKKCTPIPIEAVVRGYITGVTGTSLWTHYSDGKRDFGNFILPEGLQKNQKLQTPVFTPSTKDDAHDVTMSPSEMIEGGVITAGLMNQIENASMALYERGVEIAKQHGLILVDTKYEFGLNENGMLTLIDEIHTPDSSRYWQLDSYEQRFAAQQEPENFDKEFLRLWFKENCDPYGDTVLPEAPEDLVLELSHRYIHVYEQLTETKFTPGSAPILERIQRNLGDYIL
ncbi:MAG: purC [Candidatus Kaiserbacteria bacterium]|nr:purC [Candidatus Kaiserbacteria bacterium]